MTDGELVQWWYGDGWEYRFPTYLLGEQKMNLFDQISYDFLQLVALSEGVLEA